MNRLVAIIGRDCRLAFRSGGGAANGVVFFALVTIIFAIAIGPDPTLLTASATSVLWAGATLSGMLSYDRIFQADFEDGSFDSLIETGELLSLTALAKAVAHWLTTILPLIVVTPVLGLLLGLDRQAYGPMIISLALGTPGLSFLGVLVSALTLSLRRASLLMTILTAPLVTPALIFGVEAAKAGAANDPLYGPSLMILSAISLSSGVVLPLAAAAAIRFNID